MVGRKRVLVVEDDTDVRQLVAGLMVDAGFDAQTAVDGDHAIRSAAALQPDLIILDIYVPEAELAIRFAQEYRRRVRAENRAPIIAMSARPDLESFAQQIGASSHLRKPFDNEELVSLARKLLTPAVADRESASSPEAASEAPQVEPGKASA